jgi:REP element-mobilizing transposase RayT
MSYTRLRYHIVTATHRRAPVITAPLEGVLFRALRRKADDEGGRLLAIGGVADHVHLVAALRPTVALSDFVRALKARSSRAATRSDLLGAPFRWQRGYGAFTLDARDIGAAVRYVVRQKVHHGAGTTREVYERIE